MATKIQLETALKNAHAAGDAESAKKIANALKAGQYDLATFSPGEMASNIWPSTKKFAGDITYPLLHPIQTAQGMYDVARGGVEKLIPDTINGVDFGPGENEQVADAFGQFYKDRFGDFRFMAPPNERVLNTLQTDPVGFMADVSGLLSLNAGNIGKFGRAIDPLTAGINVTRKTAGKIIPKSKPVNMINSAVKWNTTTPMNKRNRMATTMLDEGIMPTYAGVRKIERIVNELNDKIDNIVQKATKQGKKIKIDDLVSNIDDEIKKIDSPSQPEAGKMVDAYKKQIDVYLDDWKRQGVTEMTPAQVQEFKKNLYRHIDFNNTDKSAQVVSEGQDAARMDVAAKARQEIENLDPSVSGTNRREGRLLELNKELPRKASRIQNRNAISLNMAPMTGLGAFMDYTLGLPGVSTGALLLGNYMDLPKPKARNALMLRNMQNASLLDSRLAPYLMRQGAYQSGRYMNQ